METKTRKINSMEELREYNKIAQQKHRAKMTEEQKAETRKKINEYVKHKYQTDEEYKKLIYARDKERKRIKKEQLEQNNENQENNNI